MSFISYFKFLVAIVYHGKKTRWLIPDVLCGSLHWINEVQHICSKLLKQARSKSKIVYLSIFFTSKMLFNCVAFICLFFYFVKTNLREILFSLPANFADTTTDATKILVGLVVCFSFCLRFVVLILLDRHTRKPAEWHMPAAPSKLRLESRCLIRSRGH